MFGHLPNMTLGLILTRLKRSTSAKHDLNLEGSIITTYPRQGLGHKPGLKETLVTHIFVLSSVTWVNNWTFFGLSLLCSSQAGW